MKYSQELRDKIAEEYRDNLRSQGLQCSSQHIGLLESVLDRNLKPDVSPKERDFDFTLLESLQDMSKRKANRIIHSLTYNYPNPTDGDALLFYTQAKSGHSRNIGDKSVELLRRYLVERGLLRDNANQQVQEE